MTYIPASDIVDLQTAINNNSEVNAAYVLRHNRSHSLTSHADHSDVLGTPSEGDVLAWNQPDGAWEPMAINVTADGGTR